jgi:hypothetical protein
VCVQLEELVMGFGMSNVDNILLKQCNISDLHDAISNTLLVVCPLPGLWIDSGTGIFRALSNPQAPSSITFESPASAAKTTTFIGQHAHQELDSKPPKAPDQTSVQSGGSRS